MLSELFSEMLAELRQLTLFVANEDEIDPIKLIKRLASDDLLITNENYVVEQRDYQVLDFFADIVLTVSADGRLINGKDADYYLDNEVVLQRLINLYTRLSKCDTVYIVSFE